MDGAAEARAAAEAADVAIVVLGNHPLVGGRETEDRTGTALPETQEALLREVAAVRRRTALVVMSSYPYALDWADAHVPAVVWTSHGGRETGRAPAAVLLGDADPAGRLPQTGTGATTSSRTRSTMTSSRRAGPTSTTGPGPSTPSATACPTPTPVRASRPTAARWPHSAISSMVRVPETIAHEQISSTLTRGHQWPRRERGSGTRSRWCAASTPAAQRRWTAP